MEPVIGVKEGTYALLFKCQWFGRDLDEGVPIPRSMRPVDEILAQDQASREALLRMPQNVWKCFTMGQQVSKGVMFLHIQVRKLSLLGIAVAGVCCCMGLRSVSIEPRSCLLLCSEPSIVSYN